MVDTPIEISASIVGGIGDIIFGLEGFKEICESMSVDGTRSSIVTKCYLCTHCKDGSQLLRANPYVNHISTIEFGYNFSHRELLAKRCATDKNYIGQADTMCHSINPTIYLPQRITDKMDLFYHKRIKQHNKRLVIVHPIGSQFSCHFLGNIKQVATKELAPAKWHTILNLINGIIFKPYIILIGSKEDKDIISEYGLDSIPNVHNYAGRFSMLESTALITKATLVLGVDSFAKSISLASKIPSVVFVNNNDDTYRDKIFLNPYESKEYAVIIHDANIRPIDDIIYDIITELEDIC